MQIGDEELDGRAGRKELCGHTGEQGAGAAANVKLIPFSVNRVVVLGTQRGSSPPLLAARETCFQTLLL